MKTIKVPLSVNAYSIIVGTKMLSEIGVKIKALKCGSDAFVITNPVIQKHYASCLAKSLRAAGCSVHILSVPDGEKSKTLKTAESLLEQIAQKDVLRKPFVIALGGGVIGDLAGFVAAVYKRGIPVIQVPTTFLAQIDSAIGGKTAVDLPCGKNLVGAFYQPRMVFSDVSVLRTLDQRQILNGLSEAVKYGVIDDERLFALIEDYSDKLLSRDERLLQKVIIRCSQIKADVVRADEREMKGVRTILNFGHTIGHAIEAACAYGVYQHGEAVALGMRAAAEISYNMGLADPGETDRLQSLLSALGLPETIRKAKIADVLKIMQHDKKFISGKNRFVLMQKIGRVKVVENVPLDLIKSVLKNLFE